MSLYDLSYRTGKLEFRSRMVTEPEWALEGYLDAYVVLGDDGRVVTAAWRTHRLRRA